MSTNYKLPELRMQISGRQDWSVTVPFDTAMDAVLRPEFWAHNARKVNPGDEISIVPDGLAWYVRAYVVDRGDNWVKVVPLYKADLAGEEAETVDPDAQQFDIAWKGPQWQFAVFKAGVKGAEPVAKGFRTRGEANRWVLENGRSLAA